MRREKNVVKIPLMVPIIIIIAVIVATGFFGSKLIMTAARYIYSNLATSEDGNYEYEELEDGTIEIQPELAFSTEAKDIYRFVQAQTGNDLKLDGAINLPELTANAEAMGGRYEAVSRVLFRNPEIAELMDQNFRMQTPEAKAKEAHINLSTFLNLKKIYC